MRLYDQWCLRNVIPGTVFNRTESGWIDENCFYDYLLKLFTPGTRHLLRPLLLILDNHSTHLSIKTAKLAIQHNIHILCLPSHATHMLQPLDLYTFKYVKTQWRNLLWDFNKSSRNKLLDKPDFVRLFSKLYNYALLLAQCTLSFAKGGIFPFDRRIVRNEKLINNGIAASTISNTNPLQRTLSVEFDGPSPSERSPTAITTTVQRNRLVKCPSAPNLHVGEYSLIIDCSSKFIFIIRSLFSTRYISLD